MTDLHSLPEALAYLSEIAPERCEPTEQFYVVTLGEDAPVAIFPHDADAADIARLEYLVRELIEEKGGTWGRDYEKARPVVWVSLRRHAEADDDGSTLLALANALRRALS